ncbi:MAG: hypothetical protein HY692_01655 [Cyanobacteria bacterium NC_groundwater_1444_Ag_S-0.65um_54_12]|nr:hypothetical protein [Cyanobacteria bacterium NC_groundwater_1444_Ag_S-0.65um_54_12]
MTVEIEKIVIERKDGQLFCGILFYSTDKTARYLPWSVDLENPKQVVLKLFPPDTNSNLEIIRNNYEVMADAIVERVMKNRSSNA